MSARFKCNQCLNEFTVTEDMGSQSCPYCGSFDVIEKSGGIKFNASGFKKFRIPVLILLAIFLIILFWPNPKCPTIKEVNADRMDCRITVTAEPCRGTTVKYSFDNGKSYQQGRVYRVGEPGTFYIMVKDDKNRTAKWSVPITFSEQDLAICEGTPPPLPVQIARVDKSDETDCDLNDGRIEITTKDGARPIEFSIDNGQSWSADSVFSNLIPGNYMVRVKDANTSEDVWPDTLIIIEFTIGCNGPPLPPPPSMREVENRINELFNDPDSRTLLDSVNVLFASQTMSVDCELINIPANTPYQLFQFLQRRFDGKPGTKRIEVIDIGYDNGNRVNRMKVREIPVSGNN